MAVRIKLRYDTYANWNSNNGTLAQGELGLVDYGNNNIVIHSGVSESPTLWSSCPIVNEGVTTLSGLTDVNLTDLENGDILLYSGGSWITSSGSITINNTTVNPGGTHTISAATQNALTFGTEGFNVVGNGSTFDGSEAITVSLDLSTYTLSNNNFFVGNGSDKVTTIGSTGSGEVVRAQSPIITGTLNAQDLVLSGNLTVNGTTTTINTNILTVDDINIELGSTTDPDDNTANNGGITLKGSTDKTFNWILGTTSWTSSEHLDLASEKVYKINGTGVLKSDALGSGLFLGTNSRETPQNADRLLIYHTGDWSSWITWENLKSSLEAAISGVAVELNMPDIFIVTPTIDTDGTTFDVDFETQTANNIFAGPSSGSPAKPTFRTLATDDLPNVSGLTPSTYTSVTVDAKGRVTSGTNPTTLSGYGITDALSNSTSATQDGYFGNIHLYDDTSPSHYLQITNSANLTGLRTLSINVEDSNRSITLGGNLTVSAAATISGTNTGDQTITLTGPVTGSGTGSFETTITDKAVTFAKIQDSDSAGLSVIGRSTNSAGVFAEINAATDGHVLRRSGTSLGFGTIATAGIGDSQVTLAKIENIGANTILGNNTGSSAVATALSISDVKALLNISLNDLSDVGITTPSGGNILVYDESDGWINTDVIYGGNAASFT